MWLEKLCRGVLQISTDSGLRSVEPTFTERVRLLWTFRNFQVLPEEVLSPKEKHFIAFMCKNGRVKAALLPEGDCVIGTVELHTIPMKFPPRKSAPLKAVVSHQSPAAR